MENRPCLDVIFGTEEHGPVDYNYFLNEVNNFRVRRYQKSRNLQLQENY